MTFQIKAKYLIVLAALLAVITVFGFATLAHANPFYTGKKAQSATATSTQAFVAPGVGTSTIVYDSYEQLGTNEPKGGDLTIPNNVALLLNGLASSSLTVVNVACEYSDNWDGSNGDWYQNDILAASSTGPLAVTVPVTISFSYATSTIGGLNLNSTNSTAKFQKMVDCPVPLRFVRAVVTTTGAGASMWTQFVPKKQRNSGN